MAEQSTTEVTADHCTLVTTRFRVQYASQDTDGNPYDILSLMCDALFERDEAALFTLQGILHSIHLDKPLRWGATMVDTLD
jgi:hypothetical protein